MGCIVFTVSEVTEVSHFFFDAVNKQLNDKERVAAALENPNLVDMVDECLAPSYGWICYITKCSECNI